MISPSRQSMSTAHWTTHLMPSHRVEFESLSSACVTASSTDDTISSSSPVHFEVSPPNTAQPRRQLHTSSCLFWQIALDDMSVSAATPETDVSSTTSAKIAEAITAEPSNTR